MEQNKFENWKFHKTLTLVMSEAIIFNEFSSLTRISLLAAVTFHDITRFVKRLAVRVIPVPGCFGQISMKNRFSGRRVFKPEIFEICTFVWSNFIFP